jgi:hypothetical protein
LEVTVVTVVIAEFSAARYFTPTDTPTVIVAIKKPNFSRLIVDTRNQDVGTRSTNLPREFFGLPTVLTAIVKIETKDQR